MTEAQQRKQYIAISKLIKGTFDTELGRKLLDHFKKVAVDRPIYKQGQTLDQTAYRQGQADWVNQIIKELNNGR